MQVTGRSEVTFAQFNHVSYELPQAARPRICPLRFERKLLG